MNCLEAQSYIMPFIEGKVPEHKQEEFVLHMKNCPKCHEELEIYYTLIVGMKQLDNQEELSSNFSRDLENKLNHLQNKVKGRRGIKVSTFALVCFSLIAVMIIFYEQCLNRVYAFEQETKRNNQSSYYFYRELNADLFLPALDRLETEREAEEKQTFTLYDKIKIYDAVTNAEQEIFDIGGVITRQ